MLNTSEIALLSKYQEFQELFTEKRGKESLPEYKPQDHEIPIIDDQESTHYKRLIPLSTKEKNFLKEYIEKHLEKGFIRSSSSSIAYGVLFTPKKDGSLRPYINYRKLNTITKKNRYPLLRINELQNRLLHTKIFTAIDIRNTYYRIQIKEEEEQKTAFKIRQRLYKYLIISFRLINILAIFQELINNIL